MYAHKLKYFFYIILIIFFSYYSYYLKIHHEIIIQKESYNINNTNYFKDKKLVALTFDDGPNSKTTKKLLTELKKRQAKASFFMLGEKVASEPDLVRNIYNEGHSIGSHTYSHKNLNTLTDQEIKDEINKTNELIKSITGSEVKYLRPPYGLFKEETLATSNMTFILWNVDTEDWKYKNSKRLTQYLIDHIDDGDIILLHDIYESTITGVLDAIDILKPLNYEFVSIDELAQYKNIPLEKNKVYHSIKS